MTAYVAIFLNSDWSEIDAELRRLGRMPDGKTVRELNAAFDLLFEMSQEDVHVWTGALKGTARKSHDTDRAAHTWEGDMVYGEEPLDYAIYELARGIGGAGGASDAKGDHDFMRRVRLLGDDILAAALERGLRG